MVKKSIYFVLGGYPVVSHTFLYNQICEVCKNQNLDVKIITFNRINEKVHETYKSLDDKIILIPVATGLPILKRLKISIQSFLGLLFSKPNLLSNSLNFSKYGRNSGNLNYIVLANSFRKINADIFHCHFGPTAKMITDLKDIGAVKSKVLVSFHGMDITVFPKKYGKEFYARLFKKGDLFTGNSNFIIEKMYENDCPKPKTHKIPECLNIEQFTYRGINIPPRDVFKILTVGRFVEKKGYEFSLRAIALFSKHGIAFEYHIIGEGPLKEAMINLSIELGIRNHVVFHGAMKQDKVLEQYSTSHLFLLPSVTAADGDTEGQGLVLQEAQAIGLPVLATLHNGFPDSIIDGKTGYLVPEKSVEGLYEKVLLFSKDENLCREMGERGRLFVEQSFASKVVVKNLLELYEKLY